MGTGNAAERRRLIAIGQLWKNVLLGCDGESCGNIAHPFSFIDKLCLLGLPRVASPLLRGLPDREDVALALVLSGASDGRSLNIGFDVLPEAYTFAASRIGFVPNLRLTSCNASRCLWDLGGGVGMTADHAEDSLSINRIEAKLDTARAVTPEAVMRFEKACLAIVALVAPNAPPADQRSTAKAISAMSDPATESEAPDRNVSFYGARSRAGHEAGPGVAAKCGAFVSS